MQTTQENERRAFNLLASGSCSTIYADFTKVFRSSTWCFDPSSRSILARYVAGKKVLDLGCGPNGGLLDVVLQLGARDYLGVDVNSDAVALSQKRHAGNFVCDDPIHLLGILSEPHTVISSAFFDYCVLQKDEYINLLVQAIAKHTPQGEHTLHYSNHMGETSFAFYFSTQGFQRLPESTSHFGIFRKK